MSWVRLDEEFAKHPKVVAAGPLGMAMQVAALCYCNQYLTDGFVPRAVAVGLLDFTGLGMRMWSGELSGGGEDASWQLVVEDLVTAGLWEPAEGGWRIHDYHDYQPSREHVLSIRKTRQAVGHKGGLASGNARRAASTKQIAQQPPSNAEANGQPNGEAKTNPGPVPVPKVKIKTIVESDEPTRPISLERQLFELWRRECRKSGRVEFSPARQRALTAALKAYPFEDIADAIRGVALDPWRERAQHDDILVIVRLGGRGNRNNLEFFRDLYRSNGRTERPPLMPADVERIVPDEETMPQLQRPGYDR